MIGFCVATNQIEKKIVVLTRFRYCIWRVADGGDRAANSKRADDG